MLTLQIIWNELGSVSVSLTFRSGKSYSGLATPQSAQARPINQFTAIAAQTCAIALQGNPDHFIVRSS